MRQKDQIVFFNFSPRLQALFRRAIGQGLRKVRAEIGYGWPAEVLVYYDPNESGFVTDGRIITKQAFRISCNLKEFKKLGRGRGLKGLAGTAAHEYMHCLRDRSGPVKNYYDKLAEEGLACYFQTLLVGPPEYLDFKGTKVEDIVKWWKWWHKKYFSRPIDSVPGFETDQGMREGFYRIAYHIAASYADAHPRLTLKKLLTVPRKEILAFARKLLGR